MEGPVVTIGEPRWFCMRQVIAINAISAISQSPGLLALLIGVGAWGTGPDGDTIALTCVGIAVCLAFVGVVSLPACMGNPYVVHLVRKGVIPAPGREERAFIVQIALRPRLHTGIRGWLEDADDVGYLTVTPEGLRFRGDHVAVDLPASAIDGLQSCNIGARGGWVAGRRIKVTAGALGAHESIEFSDRSALTVMDSNRNSTAIEQAIWSLAGANSPTRGAPEG